MTLALLNEIEVETSFENNIITVKPRTYNLQPAIYNLQPTTDNWQPITAVVESDWSSASYFYSIVALSEIGTQITLSSYKKESLQGDAILSEVYTDFGVQTVFNENQTVTLEKVNINDNLNLSNNENGNSKQSPQLITHDRKPITLNLQLKYDLNKAPDIAQTIAVTCFGLGIGCYLTGLHTLKIKETDRLEALKNELEKLDAVVTISADSIVVEPRSLIRENIKIKTYQDHRMAMAFAPLALKTSLIIEDAEVVSKSYPSFWTDLKSIGFKIDETTAL
jgi:3-phosphoshikimate 1-carboxyvinyltransferase